MSACAETLVWICIVLVKLTLLFITVGLGYMLSLELKKRNEGSFEEDSQELNDLNDKIFNFYVLVGLSGTVTLVYMCLIFCNCDSLKKAIDVIDAASDFLAKTKKIVLVPVLFFFLQIIAVKLWLIS